MFLLLSVARVTKNKPHHLSYREWTPMHHLTQTLWMNGLLCFMPTPHKGPEDTVTLTSPRHKTD